MRIRIYCGLKDRFGVDIPSEDIDAFLDAIAWDGFTIIKCEGYWRGAKEPSFIIERIDSRESVDEAEREAIAIAQAYADRFEQDSVLVTTENGKFRIASVERSKHALSGINWKD